MTDGSDDFRHEPTKSTIVEHRQGKVIICAASTELQTQKTVKICVEKEEINETSSQPDVNRVHKEGWSKKKMVKHSLKFGAWMGVATIWFSCFGLVVTLDPVEQGTEARLVVCLLGGLVFQMLLIACKDNFRRHAVRKAGMCLGREHWLVRAAARAVMHRKVGVTENVGVHSQSHCGLC